jgi:hypothetical protein
MTSAADIDELIQRLHEMKAQLHLCAKIEDSFVIGRSSEESDRG